MMIWGHKYDYSQHIKGNKMCKGLLRGEDKKLLPLSDAIALLLLTTRFIVVLQQRVNGGGLLHLQIAAAE